MASINTILADRAVTHMLYLTRKANGEANWLAEQIEERYTDPILELLLPLIVAIVTGQELLTSMQQAKLTEIQMKIRQLGKILTGEIYDDFVERLEKVIEDEATFVTRLYENTIPLDVGITPPDTEGILQGLMAGKPIQQWLRELGENTSEKVADSLREGLIEGEGTDELLDRISDEGVLGEQISNAQVIAESAALWSSNRSRDRFFEANMEVFSGWEIIITLDSRTCLRCVSKEMQNPYPLENKPQPIFHLKCRCVVVPVTKSWQELGFDFSEVPQGMRAAMDGQVPESMDYMSWLKRQSEAVQIQALGQSRWELWKSGKVEISEFVGSGQILTLEQIRGLEGDIFNEPIGVN